MGTAAGFLACYFPLHPFGLRSAIRSRDTPSNLSPLHGEYGRAPRGAEGYEADGYYGAASWLRARTRVTRGAAAAATGWARRLSGHPVIAAALAAGQVPASLARLICDWADQLPGELRDDGDGILLAAVPGRGGSA